jgi:hypothetical protein
MEVQFFELDFKKKLVDNYILGNGCYNMSITYTFHMSLVYASTSLPKFVHITSLESSC